MPCVEMRPGMWVEHLSKASVGDAEYAPFAQRMLTAHLSNTCYGLLLDGQFVSFSAVHFSSSPRKNAWGRYVSWSAAYTPLALRRRHHATELWRAVRQIAILREHDRVKSVAKGKLGFYLHRSLGHEFWGWDKGGRGLIVDSALAGSFPEGVPIEARCAVDAHLMGEDELISAEARLL